MYVSVEIGLVMLQGARQEHADALLQAAKQLQIEIKVVELRTSDDIMRHDIGALVFPGGESSTMRKTSEINGLLSAIFNLIDDNPCLPILGTCAGAIIMCESKNGRSALIDVKLDRNAYGGQAESFQADLEIVNLDSGELISQVTRTKQTRWNNRGLPVGKLLGDSKKSFPGIFIRAPRFTHVNDGVNVIAQCGDEAVGVVMGTRMALTFHPELTTDYRFHRWLLMQALDS